MFELSPQMSSVLLLGFLLGLKHATDADHVVAVAAIISNSNSVWKSIWIGASWGIGHSIPLIIIGLIILFVKERLLDYYQVVAPFFEIGVGAMLIILGIQVLRNLSKGKVHMHMHLDNNQPHVHIHATHTHKNKSADKVQHGQYRHGMVKGITPFFRPKSFFVGLMHSLAGTAAILILLLPSIDSNWTGMGYLILFGIGTILSMSAATLVLSLPIKLTFKFPLTQTAILSMAGLINLALGAILITEVISGYEIVRF